MFGMTKARRKGSLASGVLAGDVGVWRDRLIFNLTPNTFGEAGMRVAIQI